MVWRQSKFTFKESAGRDLADCAEISLPKDKATFATTSAKCGYSTTNGQVRMKITVVCVVCPCQKKQLCLRRPECGRHSSRLLNLDRTSLPAQCALQVSWLDDGTLPLSFPLVNRLNKRSILKTTSSQTRGMPMQNKKLCREGNSQYSDCLHLSPL